MYYVIRGTAYRKQNRGSNVTAFNMVNSDISFAFDGKQQPTE